ncbi:MFS transporter [uncultured Mitsuokella sp.]|uniref:MFS transporter n=1 Tax=uncultured Mitsuokella sp. TaxID=453120 RepID=UPI0026271920|nr:MFS transporter [uncultured Mitsuokella sp.]
MNEEKARNVETLWTAEFIGMSATNFFHLMAQYILIVGLPIYIMNEMKGGELEAGLAMTFFQIGTVSSRPFAGRLIDSLHKGRLLLGATLAFFVIMLAFCFAHTEEALYTLRFLQGIEFALGTTAAATLAALVLPAAKKGTGIGYFALSTNLAMVVGPFIGLVLIGNLGAEAFFAFMIGIGVLTLLLANARRLPDEVKLPARKREGVHLSDFVAKEAIPPSLIGGLVFFAYGGIITFIPLYAKSLGLSSETSIFFAVFAAVIVLTRPVVGRIFDAHGADFTVYPGYIFFAVGMIVFSQAAGVIGLLVAAAVLGVGFGALSPAFQTMAVRSVPLARSGVATATYFWSLDISVGLAAVLLGFVVSAFGYAMLYGIVGVAVIALSALCYFLWRRLRAGEAKAA